MAVQVHMQNCGTLMHSDHGPLATVTSPVPSALSTYLCDAASTTPTPCMGKGEKWCIVPCVLHEHALSVVMSCCVGV